MRAVQCRVRVQQSVSVAGCGGNPDAKRLYDDLLSNYNKLVRPVLNVSDALTVRIKLKLSQLIDVVRRLLCSLPTPCPCLPASSFLAKYCFLFFKSFK